LFIDAQQIHLGDCGSLFTEARIDNQKYQEGISPKCLHSHLDGSILVWQKRKKQVLKIAEYPEIKSLFSLFFYLLLLFINTKDCLL